MCSNGADFVSLNSPISISHKTLVTEKFYDFHTVLHMKLFDNPWPYLYFKYVIFHQVSSTGSHIVSPLLVSSWKQHLLKVHLGITENWRTAFVFGTQMSQIFRQSDFTFDGRTEADICCWLRYITTTRARVRYTLLGILLHIWVICLEVLGVTRFFKNK